MSCTVTNATGLTADQSRAFAQICAFAEDSECRCFVLQGYAGTGKTFLIGHVARWLRQNNLGVQLLAPTGRAARVITEKTGISGSTIHRGIYNLDELVELDDKHASFKFYFQLRNTAADDTKMVYIVDESSMVSDFESDGEFIRFGSGRLLQDLFEFIRIGDETCTSKIIFVGDPAQLSPVNMNTSPALDPDYLGSTHDVQPEIYCLTEVVRQAADSAILAAATRIRSNIELQRFNELMIKPRRGEIEATTADGVARLWADVYKPAAPEMPPPFVCVTHTNDAALRYNLMIRGALFGGSGEQQVRIGDYLMVVANSRMTGLLNGDLAVVLEADEYSEHRRVGIFVEGEETHVELQFRGVELGYEQANAGPTRMRCLILENVLFSDLRDITPEQQKALYVDFKIRRQDLKANTKRFSEALLEDPYFNALRVKFGYAATCYKAQGGEWPQAAVVFEHTRTDLDGLRWAYTAITRARQRLYCVNLPNKMPWTGLTAARRGPAEAPAGVAAASAGIEARSAAGQEARFLDAFPAEPAFLKSKHCAAVEGWAAAGIQVEDVEVAPSKYFVRYRLRKEQSSASLQMYFSLKRKFTVQVLPGFGADESLASQARHILEAASGNGPAEQNAIDASFPEDRPALKSFYDELVRPRSERAGLAIVSLTHMPYRERYVFRTSQGGQATVDFIYNERGEFTKHEAAGDRTAQAVVESILSEG